MKRISVLFFVMFFFFGYSQTEEFKTADDLYNKKMKMLVKKSPKESVERSEQEKLLLEEKLASYRKTLEKISVEEQKGITEYPAPAVPPVTKKPEFELGEAQFKKLLSSAYSDNISLLNYPGSTYLARLTCTVDSKGYVYDARVKGKNPNINTFILAALYIIKDKGKWKPAEIKGSPILYAFSYPITLKFEEE